MADDPGPGSSPEHAFDAYHARQQSGQRRANREYAVRRLLAELDPQQSDMHLDDTALLHRLEEVVARE